MAIKDIHQIYQEYVEANKYRAFLYTPGNVFAGELDLIEPRLSLKKAGFDILEFGLPARLFDLSQNTLKENPFIDYTLDGYYIIFQFGDLENDNYQQRQFVIKNRNSSLSDEQAVFSYSAISTEYELKKMPLIN